MKLTKKCAIDKLDILKNNYNHVLIIHYSCESFIDKPDGYTPRISSIAIKNFHTGQTVSFSIHKVAEMKNISKDNIESMYDQLEKEMLDEYFEFIGHHKEWYYVHWNMRDINYGFEAIKHRYRVLGGKPIDIQEERLVDLSRLLIDYYGSNYIGHPRLEKLIDKNEITKKNFLTGKEEAQCFSDKEYIRLHLSTLRKVDSLFNVLSMQLNGKLKIDISPIAQMIDRVLESVCYKVLSVLAVLWTIISFFIFFV